MSNSNSPRVLKLKKLPKGIFKWKVCFHLTAQTTDRISQYDRYMTPYSQVTSDIYEYLGHNLSGKHSIHYIDDNRYIAAYRNNANAKAFKKPDYVLMENQFDVSMFKLVFNGFIRQIYKIQVDA